MQVVCDWFKVQCLRLPELQRVSKADISFQSVWRWIIKCFIYSLVIFINQLARHYKYLSFIDIWDQSLISCQPSWPKCLQLGQGLMLETSNCNLVIFWRCSWGTQWSDWWMSEWRRGESHRCGCPESCPRPPPCGAAHSRGQSRSSCSSKCEILLRPWDATQTPEWC